MSKEYGPDEKFKAWYDETYPPVEGCDPKEREMAMTQWWCIQFEIDMDILSDLSYYASKTDEERKESVARYDQIRKEYDEWHREYWGPPKKLVMKW